MAGVLHPQVETEVLAHYEQQLLEKENSGCAALLRDDKVLNPLQTSMMTLLQRSAGQIAVRHCMQNISSTPRVLARLLCATACRW
jgi:hypothetical protein